MTRTAPTIPGKAERDECCAECGWPFDAGDACRMIEGQMGVFCTEQCAEHFWRRIPDPPEDPRPSDPKR